MTDSHDKWRGHESCIRYWCGPGCPTNPPGATERATAPNDAPEQKCANPGSREAVKAGCICAVLDNYHGKGFGKGDDGKPLFWITEGCPLHAMPPAPPDGEDGPIGKHPRDEKAGEYDEAERIVMGYGCCQGRCGNPQNHDAVLESVIADAAERARVEGYGKGFMDGEAVERQRRRRPTRKGKPVL